MKVFLFTAIILCSRISTAQSFKNNPVADSIIEKFVEEVMVPLINTPHNPKGILLKEPIPFLEEKEIRRVAIGDTLFDEHEVPFIALQIQNHRNFLWDSSFIKIKTMNTLTKNRFFAKHKYPQSWDRFNRQYGYGYCKMSLPCFTSDFQTCIIAFDHNCGPECGEGSYRIYKRENSVWKLYKEVFRWIA